MRKIAIAAAITLVGALGLGPSSLMPGASAHSSGCNNPHDHAAYVGSTVQRWTDTRQHAWTANGQNYYGFTTYHHSGFWDYQFKYGGAYC
jgi:hypothetical protein